MTHAFRGLHARGCATAAAAVALTILIGFGQAYAAGKKITVTFVNGPNNAPVQAVMKDPQGFVVGGRTIQPGRQEKISAVSLGKGFHWDAFDVSNGVSHKTRCDGGAIETTYATVTITIAATLCSAKNAN